MRTAFKLIAMPFYAVAIGAQVCLLAYRVARFNDRQRRQSREATEQHNREVRAGLNTERAKLAEGLRRDWTVN